MFAGMGDFLPNSQIQRIKIWPISHRVTIRIYRIAIVCPVFPVVKKWFSGL